MKLISRYCHQLCAVYTVAVLFLLLLNAAMGSSMNTTTVNTAAFLWLFVFAALFTAANLQLKTMPYSYALRVLIHCVVTVGAAFGLLYLPNHAGSASSAKLMMFILMLMLYWMIMAIYLVLHAKHQKAVAAKQPEPSRVMAASDKKTKKEQTTYRNLFSHTEDGAE